MRNNKQKTMILTWRCSVCLDFPPAEKDVTSMYTNYHLSHCYVITAKDILTTFLSLLIIYMSLFICNSRYWISIKYYILMQKHVYAQLKTFMLSYFIHFLFHVKNHHIWDMHKILPRYCQMQNSLIYLTKIL